MKRRDNVLVRLMIGLALLAALGSGAVAKPSDNPYYRKIRTGRSCQMNIGWAYYGQGRSPESLASEVALEDYDYVQIENTDETVNPAFRKAFVQELHRRGIGAVGAWYAWSIYTPTKLFPEGWEAWQMQFSLPTEHYKQAGWTFLSPIHEGYRRWLKDRIIRGVRDFGYDAVILYEPHYPNGFLDRETKDPAVLVGDVGPAFRDAFRQATGHESFPNFTDPDDPNYYRKDTKLFADLVDFRVRVVNDFYEEIFNGKGGVRETFPDLLVGTWTVAISWDDGRKLLREAQGIDAASLVRAVRPDFHFLQVHAPDWAIPQLSPDFGERYHDFVRSVRAVDSRLAVGLQADVGTYGSRKKADPWLADFERLSRKEGYDTTTYAEFFLRWKLYYNRPEAREVTVNGDTLQVAFDQRIDPSHLQQLVGRKVLNFMEGKEYEITAARADGNILLLTTSPAINTRRILSIPLAGIRNDASVRLPVRPDAATEEERRGPINTHPDEAYAYLESSGR